MLKPVLYLDMDGVLANFEGWAASLFGEFPLWKQEIEKPEWGRFANYPDMFVLLPMMPDALELYHGCVDLMGDPNQVQILTALPNRASHKIKDAAQHKIEWAKKHISSSIRVRFGPFAQHKQYHFQHPQDILVDDMKLNIDQWRNAGGFGVIHTRADLTLSELQSHMK